MKYNYDHVAFSVKHLEKTIKFYNHFGFEKFNQYENDEKNLRIVMLKNNEDMYIELFNYSDLIDLPKTAKENKTDLPIVGTKHIAFRVNDIEEAKQDIVNLNLGSNIEINTGRLGRKYFFIKDPNGILIEIIEEN